MGCKKTVIPDSVTSIGRGTFDDCSGLTSIKVSKENKYYDSRNNCNAIIETKSNTLVLGCKKTAIPDSVTSIGDRAFYGCSGLTSITIPKSVKSIGYEALCAGDNPSDNLVVICYKNSVAYKWAKMYANVSVKIISATEKTATPAKKGTTLTVSSKKLQVKVTSSSKKNPTVTITNFTDKKAKKLTIPATVKAKGVTYKVTAISDKAFKGNKKLTTVTIGSNVTKIGKEAFSGCKNLKKITVTAGKLKTISKNAFKGINKKASITVKGTKKAKPALKKQLKKKSIGYVKAWKIK